MAKQPSRVNTAINFLYYSVTLLAPESTKVPSAAYSDPYCFFMRPTPGSVKHHISDCLASVHSRLTKVESKHSYIVGSLRCLDAFYCFILFYFSTYLQSCSISLPAQHVVTPALTHQTQLISFKILAADTSGLKMFFFVLI